MSDLKKDLIVTVVDKLAIGILIILVGYLVNLSLETHKGEQAFANEVAKIRAQKIAEIWSGLYKWEAIAEELIEKTSKLKLAQSGYESLDERYGWTEENLEKRLKELASSSQHMRLAFLETLEGNRFWLGEDLYNESLEYYHLNQDRLKWFFDIFSTKDEKKLEKIKNEYEMLTEKKNKAKQDILKLGNDL